MKNNRNTKGKIISAAWKLFYDKGYEETTVDDIVELSGTSKGSFYHYFNGKDALLSSLSIVFDERYEELEPKLVSFDTALEKLLFLNRELFLMIENSISLELLSMLFSSQLTTRGDRHLLDQSRTYYKLLRSILREAQEKGELSKNISINEVIKSYAVIERGLMYDWCLCNGDYSLAAYSNSVLKPFLAEVLKK